jgi:predicted nucleotidyltransferase/uncharacterized protein with HEPN domain
MSQQQPDSQPSDNAPGDGMSVGFEALRPQIEALCRKYGTAELSVFGSVARGDDRPDSDVDLLYVRDPDCDWEWEWEFFGVQQELEALLDRSVDIGSRDHLHWVIRDRVIAEARPLYGLSGVRPRRVVPRDDIHLVRMVEAADRVERLVREADAGGRARGDLFEAALRQQVGEIGRAAGRVSAAVRERHEDLAWERLAFIERGVLPPHLGGASLNVWRIAREEAPSVRRSVLVALHAEFPDVADRYEERVAHVSA